MRTIYSRYHRGLGRRLEYVAFLESRSLLRPDRALPLEGPQIVPAGWSDAEPIHLGLSAVVRSELRREAPPALGLGDPRPDDPEWRAARRAGLQRMFAAMPTYRLDLYIDAASDRVRPLRPDFQTGGWFYVRTLEQDKIDPAVALFAVVTGPNGEPRPAQVVRVGRADLNEKRALRRIFSLDHIGNLGDEGPGSDPAPDTPPSEPSLRSRKRLPANAVVVFGARRRRETEVQIELEPEDDADAYRIDPYSEIAPPLSTEN